MIFEIFVHNVNENQSGRELESALSQQYHCCSWLEKEWCGPDVGHASGREQVWHQEFEI